MKPNPGKLKYKIKKLRTGDIKKIIKSIIPTRLILSKSINPSKKDLNHFTNTLVNLFHIILLLLQLTAPH